MIGNPCAGAGGGQERSGEVSSLTLNSAAGLEPRGLQLPYVGLIKVNTLDPGLVILLLGT